MIQFFAFGFTPPLRPDATSAFSTKLVECGLNSGSVYISPGTVHQDQAAVAWVSGNRAVHIVAPVESLRTIQGAALAAEELAALAGPPDKGTT